MISIGLCSDLYRVTILQPTAFAIYFQLLAFILLYLACEESGYYVGEDEWTTLVLLSRQQHTYRLIVCFLSKEQKFYTLRHCSHRHRSFRIFITSTLFILGQWMYDLEMSETCQTALFIVFATIISIIFPGVTKCKTKAHGTNSMASEYQPRPWPSSWK